jgi:hypothetical protein
VQENVPPSVGLSNRYVGGLTAAGSVYRADSRREKQEKPYEGIPWLKIMIANVVIIILILLFIVVSR